MTMRRNTISALLCVCLFAVTACSKAETPNNHPLPLTVQHTQSGTETIFHIDIADEPGEQQHGLMGRQSVADDYGMLFVFQKNQIASFWMRNTPSFLDMIFIDESGKIIQIHRKARPFDDTLIKSTQPVRAVLEIKGGNAAHQNIIVGDTIKPLYW